jgi:hypothetical protein
MTKTKSMYTMKACYWKAGDNGWYKADHAGSVYVDKYGYWLKHPQGYTKIAS